MLARIRDFSCLLWRALSRYRVVRGKGVLLAQRSRATQRSIFGLSMKEFGLPTISICTPRQTPHAVSVQIVLNSRVPIVEKAASVVMDVLGDLVLKVRGKTAAAAAVAQLVQPHGDP